MGLIADLQAAVAAQIRAGDLIAEEPAVPVLEADKGDLDAEIAKAVGKRGICISVETPALNPEQDNRRFCEAELLIEVQENVPINRGPAGTQRTWLAITENIIAELMNWAPAGGWRPIEFGGYQLLNSGTPAIAQIRFTTGVIVSPA